MMMDDVHEYWRRVFHFSPFTVCFNLTGQPAIVLPLAQSDAMPERTAAGFPISVQFVARHGGEATLFRLARCCDGLGRLYPSQRGERRDGGNPPQP
jgi:Asp-tRNA(Asn)/Glu-tRNA(Gln) amidotransferase A subunit family amidase